MRKNSTKTPPMPINLTEITKKKLSRLISQWLSVAWWKFDRHVSPNDRPIHGVTCVARTPSRYFTRSISLFQVNPTGSHILLISSAKSNRKLIHQMTRWGKSIGSVVYCRDGDRLMLLIRASGLRVTSQLVRLFHATTIDVYLRNDSVVVPVMHAVA